MKKVFVILLCILLDVALISVAAASFDLMGGNTNKKDNDNVKETPVFTVLDSSEAEGLDNVPDGVYGGYPVKTANVTSGSSVKYVSEGHLYYVQSGATTYYFIRFQVDDWDVYSIRYTSYGQEDGYYPYFSTYYFSYDLITWTPLDSLCSDMTATVKEAIYNEPDPEYIDICVYAENEAEDPQNTLYMIAIQSEMYPGLYITNVEG